MKLRHWIWLAVALVLMATMVLPSVVYRHRFEEKNHYYTAAVDLTEFSLALSEEALQPYLAKLKAAGATTALIREEKKGYPEQLIQAAKKAGLGIMPEPDVCNPSLNELERLIKENQITLLKLHDNLWNEQPEPAQKRKALCRIIEENELTLVLTEKTEQLGSYHPDGFSEYLEAAQGRLMRSFTNYAGTIAADEEYPYTYYQYLNTVLDRNIRVMIASPLKDEEFSMEKNAERLRGSMEKFCQKMEALGYSKTPAPDLSAYPPRRTLPAAAVAALAVLMLSLMADLCLKGAKKWLLPASLAVSAAAFGASLLMPEGLLLLYPTGFASVGGCFCVATVFEWVRKSRQRGNLFGGLLSALGMAVGALLLCGLCQGSLMNGADYWLNEAYFRGVKFSLLLPIFFALLWQTREDFGYLRPSRWKELIGRLWHRLRWYHLLILLLAAGLGGLYILRSGNVKEISTFELNFRNQLTDWLQARPRTKEFLLGWPCLMLLVYEQRRKGGSKLFSLALSGVAAVLFASGINTFCHGFTPIEAMILRTLYGMIGGLAIGGIFLAAYWGALRLISIIKEEK